MKILNRHIVFTSQQHLIQTNLPSFKLSPKSPAIRPNPIMSPPKRLLLRRPLAPHGERGRLLQQAQKPSFLWCVPGSSWLVGVSKLNMICITSALHSGFIEGTVFTSWLNRAKPGNVNSHSCCIKHYNCAGKGRNAISFLQFNSKVL